MIYGDSARLDVGRLRRLVGGFGKFNTDALSSGKGGGAARARAVAAPAAAPSTPLTKEALELLTIVFSPEGSYLQDVLVDEAAAAADAASRAAAARALAFAGPAGDSLAASIALDDDDRLALANLEELLGLIGDARGRPRAAGSAPTPPADAGAVLASLRSFAAEVRPVAPTLAAGLARTANGIARALARRVAARVAAGTAPSRAATAQSDYNADAAFRAEAAAREGGRPGSGRAAARAPAAPTTPVPAGASLAVAALPALLLPLTAPLWLLQNVLQAGGAPRV
jgi:hypothetical protein